MFVHEKTIRRFLPSESFKDLKTLFSTISELTQISQDIRNIELMNLNISEDEVYEAESSRYLDMLKLLYCHGLCPEDFNHWLLIQAAIMDLDDGRFIES